jgi:hypothetical protein
MTSYPVLTHCFKLASFLHIYLLFFLKETLAKNGNIADQKVQPVKCSPVHTPITLSPGFLVMRSHDVIMISPLGGI